MCLRPTPPPSLPPLPLLPSPLLSPALILSSEVRRRDGGKGRMNERGGCGALETVSRKPVFQGSWLWEVLSWPVLFPGGAEHRTTITCPTMAHHVLSLTSTSPPPPHSSLVFSPTWRLLECVKKCCRRLFMLLLARASWMYESHRAPLVL